MAGAILAPAATTPATNASATRRLTDSLSSLLEALTAKERATGATRGAATVTDAPLIPLLADANAAPWTTSPDTAAAHAIASKSRVRVSAAVGDQSANAAIDQCEVQERGRLGM